MKTKNILTNPIIMGALAILCCLLWGSAFPFIKIGYSLLNIESNDTSSQILFAGLRFLLAGTLTILFGSLIKKKTLFPSKKNFFNIVKLSMFQTVLQYLLFYIGLANTDGVKSSIITGSNVFLTILVSCFIFKSESFTLRKFMGCLLGLSAIVIVNLGQGEFNLNIKANGELLLLLSAISHAFSSSLIKRYSKYDDPVLLSGYQFIFGSLLMIVFGFLMGGRLNFSNIQSVFVLLYLGSLSAIAYTVWGILLKYNSVSSVTIYGFANPIFGVILSSILLNENTALDFKVIISLILISLSIILINYNSKKILQCRNKNTN